MRRIVFSRELLLVEIERRCRDARCGARARVGLTKDEARAYEGWTCERCEKHWEDVLSERDVPEWWEELKVTGLDGVRLKHVKVEPGKVVSRMSEAWRRTKFREDSGAVVADDASRNATNATEAADDEVKGEDWH